MANRRERKANKFYWKLYWSLVVDVVDSLRGMITNRRW